MELLKQKVIVFFLFQTLLHACTDHSGTKTSQIELIGFSGDSYENFHCSTDGVSIDSFAVKITNRTDSILVIPVKERDKRFICSELEEFYTYSEKKDTIFFESLSINDHFSVAYDTLFKGESKYYCYAAWYSSLPEDAVYFSYNKGKVADRASLTMLIKVDKNGGSIQQLAFPIEKDVEIGTGVKVKINYDEEVILSSEL